MGSTGNYSSSFVFNLRRGDGLLCCRVRRLHFPNSTDRWRLPERAAQRVVHLSLAGSGIRRGDRNMRTTQRKRRGKSASFARTLYTMYFYL